MLYLINITLSVDLIRRTICYILLSIPMMHAKRTDIVEDTILDISRLYACISTVIT